MNELRLLASLGLGLLGACGVGAQAPEHLTAGDATAFEQHVQPYLEASCATLDCHGDNGRPLRLYSELGLRRDSTLRTASISEHVDPQPLTSEELTDNRMAFAAIALASDKPEDHLALRKPLALSAGGIKHEGRVHFRDREDPGYLCLRGWLVGDIAQELGTMCAQAIAALRPE